MEMSYESRRKKIQNSLSLANPLLNKLTDNIQVDNVIN